jgi:CheY-like chemotaxis protein
MSSSAADQAKPRASGRKALVVDDSPLICEVVRIALGGAGWDVETVSSGDEALHAARGAPPDVILLDVVMPGLDGPQTLARLRDDPVTSSIPVIFATAKDRPEEQEQLGQLGAAGVIAKPFDMARLAEQVSEALGATG